MKTLILLVSTLLIGCATPQQNAALTGAIIGATVAVVVHENQSYTPVCRWIRGRYIGRDLYNRPMWEYYKSCR